MFFSFWKNTIKCKSTLEAYTSLKFVVVRANIFKMPVLHPKAIRDCPELRKSEAFVKVSRMRIAFNDGVELQDAEAVLLGLF